MKRAIILPIIVLLLFSSCVKESKNCDIFEFEKRINSLYDDKIFNSENLYIDDKNIAYWCCDGNTCVSFYINPKTGNIEKCNIVFNNKKKNNQTLDKIRKSLTFNNEYMYESEYMTEKYLMISFIDKRYEKENENPILKKEIKEEDLY